MTEEEQARQDAQAALLAAEKEHLDERRQRLTKLLRDRGYEPPTADFVAKYEAERPDFELWDFSTIAEDLYICTVQPTVEKFTAAMAHPSGAEKAMALAKAAVIFPEPKVLDTLLMMKPGLLWHIGNIVLASSGFLGGGKRTETSEYLQKS